MTAEPPGEAYRASGVDLRRMESLKDRIKRIAAATHGPEVVDAAGSFAGLYQLGGVAEPVLVASADGVGTKLKIAAQLGRFQSVGRDLVTLNVNDILTRGARPLFFLDYIAFSEAAPGDLESLMQGIADGCRAAGCALIGGETAQMPQMYAAGEFDLAGFVVGVVERPRLLQAANIREGHCLLGLPSSGLHTNGFSLARRVFNTDADPSALSRRLDGLTQELGDELLTPHRSYYPMLRPALEQGLVSGLAHITGGGLPGKLPAILPPQMAAEIDRRAWQPPPIFAALQREGRLDDAEMYRVFNMGVGMVAVCPERARPELERLLPDARRIGRIIPRAGDDGVVFI